MLIDTQFLLRQVSALAQVKRNHRTWNEFGEQVVRDFVKPSTAAGVVRSEEDVNVSPEAACWSQAKGLVHEVLATREPRHDAIRKRLGNLREPSTAILLSTLGLRLAGVVGISVSVTGPMVAAMLYAAGEAGGDWEVLVDR